MSGVRERSQSPSQIETQIKNGTVKSGRFGALPSLCNSRNRVKNSNNESDNKQECRSFIRSFGSSLFSCFGEQGIAPDEPEVPIIETGTEEKFVVIGGRFEAEELSKKLVFIKVAGLGHSREVPSPIHDKVINALEEVYPGSETIFLASAVVEENESGESMTIQKSPKWQADNLYTTIDEVSYAGREPVVIAHSSASRTAVETMWRMEKEKKGSAPKAVLISPTFLNPLSEIFGRKVIEDLMTNDEDGGRIFNSIYMPKFKFPLGYFDDPMHARLAGPDYETIKTILAERAIIFVGGRDWNTGAGEVYARLFPTITQVLERENHAFLAEESSVGKICGGVYGLLEGSGVRKRESTTLIVDGLEVEADQLLRPDSSATCVDNSSDDVTVFDRESNPQFLKS